MFGFNAGCGGGLNSAGGDGLHLYSGGGGSAAPGFTGGLGNSGNSSGGLSGGGGGTFGGGGSGGFSGGGGGGFTDNIVISGGGGGGGSFARADATDLTATANLQADGNGFASIDFFSALTPIAGVPEPATWGLMLGGFGMIGAAMRRRKRQFV